MAELDVLIPTFDRAAALAVTLTSLIGQTYGDFRVVISDQSDEPACARSGELQAVLRVLRASGHVVEVHQHLPRRGLAEQRDFLLAQVRAPYALFLDDDLILEPAVISRIRRAIVEEGCGFVGCAVTGLSFVDDVRLHEQEIEFWDGPVCPEVVRPQWPQWQRYRLHNAANVYHLQQRLRICGEPARKYKVAWIGGCVLYDAQALRDCGGFGFWRELPADHCGEDVLAQLRVMARFGGCGLLPSGVYHQELPTTVVARRVDAPKVLSVEA